MKVHGQLEKAVIENVTADPTGTGLVPGRSWYRTDLKLYRVYDGTAVQEFADLLSAQTLQNKILSGANVSDYMEFDQVATPTNPASGKNRIYFKSDGSAYTLDSAGSEIPLGSGSGGGTKNYVPDDTVDIESTIGSWEDDDGGGSPSGALSIAVTTSVGEVLTGTASNKFSKTASNADTHYFKLASKTIDPIDRGKTFNGSMAFKALTGYVSDDLKIVVWDLTNNAQLNDFSSGAVTIPNEEGTIRYLFETLGTTEEVELRLVVNNTNTNAFDFSADEFYYGPSSFFEVKAEGPVGEILASGSAVVPDGFLYCDGSAVSRADYASLFNQVGTNYGNGDGSTTFNVPDLRGLFLRGQNDGSGNDPDAAGRTANNPGGNTGDAIGSEQVDELKSHNHSLPAADGRFNDSSGALARSGVGAVSGNTGGNETRPKNVNVRYYIRYRSTKNILNSSELAVQDVYSYSSILAVTIPTSGSSNVKITGWGNVGDIDPLGMIDTVNDRFNVLEDGNYVISGFFQSRTFDAVVDLKYSVNGGSTITIARASGIAGEGLLDCREGREIISLSKGDYVEFFVNGNGLSRDTSDYKFSLEKKIDLRLYGAVQNAGDAVPTGTVISSMATTAPEGYLYCDGSTVSRTAYARLYAAIGDSSGNGDGSTTFTLPDMRGRFARGMDDGAGRDPDAGTRSADATGANSGDAVGSVQADELKSHNHDIQVNTVYGNIGYDAIAQSDSNINLVWEAGRISDTGGSETRPKNVNVRHYIRY